jgi:hypothetical protein
VSVTSIFDGCGVDLKSTEVLSHVEPDHIEQYVENHVPGVESFAVTSITDSQISATVTVSTSVDLVLAQLKSAVADFLGADWSADDIEITVVANKRQSSENILIAVAEEPGSSTSSALTATFGLLITLVWAFF